MIRRPQIRDPRRAAAGALGLVLLVWSVFAAELARAHMALAGAICGGEVPHCGWCYLAAALAAGGLASLALGLRPPRAAKARAHKA